MNPTPSSGSDINIPLLPPQEIILPYGWPTSNRLNQTCCGVTWAAAYLAGGSTFVLTAVLASNFETYSRIGIGVIGTLMIFRGIQVLKDLQRTP